MRRQATPLNGLGQAWQPSLAGLEQQRFTELVQDIKQKIQQIPKLKDVLGDLEVKLEADGLVIEIMDTDDRSMFASSSAKILSKAQEAFPKITAAMASCTSRTSVL